MASTREILGQSSYASYNTCLILKSFVGLIYIRIACTNLDPTIG